MAILNVVATLWEILDHWDREKKLEPSLSSFLSPQEIPAILYGRQEVSTIKMLQSKTLLDLGIMNGKVAIRLLFLIEIHPIFSFNYETISNIQQVSHEIRGSQRAAPCWRDAGPSAQA